MPTYDIPEPARSILVHVAPILLRVCNPEEVAVGGGTALAARWKHRRSTDIDLFMTQETFGRPRDGWAPLMRDIPLLRLQGGHGWCNGILREGEFSISTTPRLLPPEAGQSSDIVCGWGMRLEDPAEILAKKFRLRMYGNGEFVSRDFYDICTAVEQDPTALRTAFAVLSEVERLEIAEEIRSLGGRLPKT